MKKDLFNLKRSRWLLFTLLTMIVGVSPTWADEYTCGFEASEGWSTEKISYVNYTTVGTGWGCIGGETLQYYNVAEGSTYKRTGSQSLTHNASYENSTIYAVTPYLAAGTISFYARYAQATYNLKIYKASYDGDTYTVEDAICSWSKTGTKLTNTFTQYSFELDEDSYVAILLDRVAMDDFSASNGLATEGGVAKPKNFTVSNVTGSSADFSWAAGSTETDWELSYGTTSGTPDNGTIIPLTETSYSLTGLTAETTYYASVRAKINDEYSAWSKEVSFTPSNAIKLTVNDGTATNSYVPIYGNYVDYYDKVEFVIPASDLADMANSDIKAIQFYMSTVASASWGNANFKIYMKEVDYTTVSSYTFTDDDTPLYNGAIDGTKADMALTLSSTYHYNGGNLLIGVYNTVKGSYKSASFYGVSATLGASAYGTNSSSLASVTSVNKQSFLPKTTFTYLPVDGPVMKVSETAFDFGTITAESTDEDKTKTFTISNTGTATLEGITVSYTGDNAFSTSPEISAQSIAVDGDAITVTVSMATETPGDYSGTITVSATDQTPVEIAVNGTYAANPATMAITLGEETVGATVAFGNVGKQATKTFTVTNTGNLKLNITSIVSNNTDDFTVSPATLEVAGGSSETFTVTFVYPTENPVLDTEKTANITITPSNEGIAPVVFAVTGTRIEQWSEDFSGNALPAGWTADENYWTFADGVAKSKYNSYTRNNYLFTPLLIVESTSETLTFDYITTAGSVSIPVYYSKNGGDYTAYSGTPSSLASGVSGTFTITGLEAGNYKFRFGNDDYNLDNFEGFKPNMNDPILSVTKNATTVTSPANYDFGAKSADASVTYNFANTGTGSINITDVAISGDGAAAYSTNWSESTTVPFDLVITRSFDAERTDAQDAIVTVTTSVGDFIINVTGTDVTPINSFPWTEDFNDLDTGIPTNWNNTEGTTTTDSYKWNSYSPGYDGKGLRFNSYNNSNGNTNFLKTPLMNLPSEKDMQLKFLYKNPTGGDFSVFISNDGGDTYTTSLATGLTGASSWTEKAIDIPSEFVNNVVIVFKGTSNYGNGDAYIYLDNVAIQEKQNGAFFAISDNANSTKDFGRVSLNADKEETYTITNSGNAALEVTFTDAEDFYVPKTVNFTKPNDWGGSKLFMYVWDESDNSLTGTYPGIEVTDAYENEYHQWVYTAIIPRNAYGIKFSDNANNATGDIKSGVDGVPAFNHDMVIYNYEGWHYDFNGLTVPAKNGDVNGSADFTIKMVTDGTPGDKSGDVVLNFDALNETSFTISLEGHLIDPTVLYVDFDEPNAFPEKWQVGANWNVYTYGSDRYAYQNSKNTASALVTTPLTVEDNQELSFKVSRYTSGSGYVTLLKVRYSQDGGATWSDYTTYYDNEDPNFGSSFTTKTIDNLPTGNLLVEFFGSNIKLDMIQGLTNTTKPAIALTESGVAVANGSTKDFENLSADGVATYTLKNIGNSPLTSTITGDGVIVSPANVELAAGETTEITVTMPFAAPFGEKTGKMTIESNDWIGDIVVNYTATIVDETSFVEDFASKAKPTGWYSEGAGSTYSGWTFSLGNASIATGTAKPLITEKIGAEEGKNVLSFDAKVYNGEEEQTLNVYTSTDRKNWSAAQQFTLTTNVQNFSLNALAEGEYYVMFEASNAVIDNITGVKKLTAPAHDLFEISNTIKSTGVPGHSYTATVTAVSLRANETDIVAELWLKKGENYYSVASLTNQSMTLNTNKTFTLTGNLPDVEGDGYKMYATVKTSDNSAFFNTDEVDFTLAHDPELTINSFAVTTPAVNADDNNEFTATFNVNVTNTGSRDLTADEVSVTLINTANAGSTFTSTWTAANSQTVFLNPGDYTSGANMAIYRWNDDDTDEQKEWALFTEVSSGFYSAELNGKENFIICRVNPATAEADLAWSNVYNQSEDLTTAAGNIFSNNGYNGQKLILTNGTMESLAKNVSTTLKVTVTGTLTNGENANYSFYAREDVKNERLVEAYTYATRTVNVTAAPVIVLNDEGDGTFATGSNRKVELTRSFNAGWATVVLPFAVDAATVSAKFGEGTKLYDLTGYENDELTFTLTTTIEAGKPYLMNLPANIEANSLTFSNVVVESTVADYEVNGAWFKGNYEAGMSMAGKYGVTGQGKLAKGGASSTMKGFRAYIELPDGAPAARIMIDDTATGIKYVLYDEAEMNGIYNLQGQRVDKARKGLYIVNGQKVFKK